VAAASLLLQLGPAAGQVGIWANQSACVFDGSGRQQGIQNVVFKSLIFSFYSRSFHI
jgi:hypothetical protein